MTYLREHNMHLRGSNSYLGTAFIDDHYEEAMAEAKQVIDILNRAVMTTRKRLMKEHNCKNLGELVAVLDGEKTYLTWYQDKICRWTLLKKHRPGKGQRSNLTWSQNNYGHCPIQYADRTDVYLSRQSFYSLKSLYSWKHKRSRWARGEIESYDLSDFCWAIKRGSIEVRV